MITLDKYMKDAPIEDISHWFNQSWFLLKGTNTPVMVTDCGKDWFRVIWDISSRKSTRLTADKLIPFPVLKGYFYCRNISHRGKYSVYYVTPSGYQSYKKGLIGERLSVQEVIQDIHTNQLLKHRLDSDLVLPEIIKEYQNNLTLFRTGSLETARYNLQHNREPLTIISESFALMRTYEDKNILLYKNHVLAEVSFELEGSKIHLPNNLQHFREAIEEEVYDATFA